MKSFLEIRTQDGIKIEILFFGKKIFSFKKKNPKPYSNKHCVKPKFCVSYSLFDGEELIEASIKSIRSQVDYINVVYQKVSWYGNPCSDKMISVLESLKERKLVDEIILFEPDLSDNPQHNERRKRNIGLRAAIKAGGNYFMTIDCDEFYFAQEMAEAKEIILKQGITHSYCAQIFYGKSPESRQISNHKECYLQFFSKIDKFSYLGNNQFSPCLVDPTRQILERDKSKHYVLHNIFMHHMSLVRKNLNEKFLNSSGYQKNTKKLQKLAFVERDFSSVKLVFDEKDFVNVPDYFNIKT